MHEHYFSVRNATKTREAKRVIDRCGAASVPVDATQSLAADDTIAVSVSRAANMRGPQL